MSVKSFNKFIGLFLLLAVLTLLKKWFNFSYIFLWIGVLIGFYLPFVDHLFYAYILRPELEVSGNIRSLVSIRKIKQLVSYVNETKDQREKLIIHRAQFQMVFALLTFYILTSSGGVVGRGLSYGFSLSLFVEQVLQYYQTKNIGSWFSDMPIEMDLHKTQVYLYFSGLVLLVFTILL